MCREQLPVWQRFYAEYKDKGVEVLSVAVDVQGPDKARPYVEKAGTAFPTVVDEDNLLSQLYGVKAVPNGLMVDEEGVLKHKVFGGFDLRKPETASLVEKWAKGQEAEAVGSVAAGGEHSQAVILFHTGLRLYRKGLVKEGVARWRQAVALEPDNYVIRKQIWAVEHPEKFYEGDVDYDWQREQMERGL
jgi:hypothetical protein